jgi:GR25 family glycosyltransferase involved in LPS biosynthesis
MSVNVNGYKLADIGRYINLDKRADRRDYFLNELSHANVTDVKRKAAIVGESGCGVDSLIQTTFDLYKEFLDTGENTMVVFEDDCKFLRAFKDNSKQICDDILNTEWDIFWLGGRNRRPIKYYSNNCYQVSSINYAQSYIITRKFAESLVTAFSKPDKQYVDIFDVYHAGIDEVLCLFPYGKELVKDAIQRGFYDLEQPLDKYIPNYIALCYKEPLTTQVNNISDIISGKATTLEDWLALPYDTNK